jgi:hypothetical protein
MKNAHALLEQCGFERWYTGGGCTAWGRDFPNCEVKVTQDASADLEPEYMADIGISVGVWNPETYEQVYWDTCHTYAEMPRLILEAFAAAMDHRGGENES